MSNGVTAVALALACLVGVATSTFAQSADLFYAGKTVRLVIGANTGGTYDALSRVLAPYLRRHLAGNPNVVAENLPGASGVRAATWMAQQAAKDGTTIAMFNQQIPMRQVLEPDQVKIDMRAFGWLGAMGKSNFVTFTWHESGIRTIEDARNREVVVGALSDDGGNAMWPLLYNRFLGTRFKVVTGYPGGNTIMLAMERREVDGQGNFPWIGVKGGWSHWIEQKKINNIVQLGLVKDAELGDTPLVLDLVKTPQERALFSFIAAQTAMIAPLAAPPGIAADRLADLRKAFMAATGDSEFVSDVAARKLPIAISSGEEVAGIIAGVLDTPAEVVIQMRAALSEARAQIVEKK